MSSAIEETRWSLVQEAQGNSEQSRAALSDLCSLYYAPVLAFTQACCRQEDTARDFTHSFFERLLQDQGIKGADPARGRFRSFLLGSVKHYLCEQATRRRALKRGGGSPHASFDETPDLPDLAALPPDAFFDRQWTCALLDHTLARLRQEQETAGKAAAWPVLMPWLAGQASHGDTAQAATQLGISETAVRVLLHRLRKRWRTLLHSELAQTLTPGADVQSELRYLLGVLQ